VNKYGKREENRSERENAQLFTQKQIKENIDLVSMYFEERTRQVREEIEHREENPKIASLSNNNMEQVDP
jgi:hypothetical protein